jgi:ferrous iron transport protein B
LPKEVGVPLIFGVLRKELSLVMLGQALGSMEFSEVLTAVQMITYAVFVVFYIPCLATMVVIRKELGAKTMWWIALMTILIATAASLFARGFAVLIF